MSSLLVKKSWTKKEFPFEEASGHTLWEWEKKRKKKEWKEARKIWRSRMRRGGACVPWMVINYQRTLSLSLSLERSSRFAIRGGIWNSISELTSATKLEGSPFRKFLLPRFSEKLFINLAAIIPRGELNRVPSNIFLCVIKLISCSILPLGRPIYFYRDAFVWCWTRFILVYPRELRLFSRYDGGKLVLVLVQVLGKRIFSFRLCKALCFRLRSWIKYGMR